MKVVVDTNVLVSSLLSSKGPPRIILKLFLGRRVDWLVNDLILAEYDEVLSRREFSIIKKDAITAVLKFIRSYALHVSCVPIKIDVPDADDLPFISCARHGKADVLVTGNEKHFPASLCRDLKVLSPADFLEFYRKFQSKG